eukprot:SAG31_NODE_4462_length_3213_cov_3.051381_2_plen_70_part_00
MAYSIHFITRARNCGTAMRSASGMPRHAARAARGRIQVIPEKGAAVRILSSRQRSADLARARDRMPSHG